MRKLWMALGALVVIFGALYAFGYDQGDGQRIGDLKISLTTAPSPPKVGQNTLRIEVRDRSGAPVTEAQATFYTFDVPPAYQIPQEYPVIEVAGKPAGDGVYTAEVNLKKPGLWKVAAKIHGAGERHPPGRPVTTAWFTVDVK